jgi:pyruvate formate lyase activating enzyme
MSQGCVFDLRHFTLHDGPGIRTAVFLKGCPLACPWCHNPEGRDPRPALLRRPERCVDCRACVEACAALRGAEALDPRQAGGGEACASCPDFGACARACPAEALQEVGRKLGAEALLALLRKDLPFYRESGGGATFTGGEPLAQPAFLRELLEGCRAEGIHAAVETSGFAAPATLLEIGQRADLLLYDLKEADAARGSALTGVDYGLCLDNLRLAAEAAAEDPGFARLAIRMPIIPGLNDGEASLRAAAELVASLPASLPARADAALSAGSGTARRAAVGAPPAEVAGPSRGLPVHLLPYHEAARGKYRLWKLDYPLAGTASPDAAAMAAALAIFTERGLCARIGG